MPLLDAIQPQPSTATASFTGLPEDFSQSTEIKAPVAPVSTFKFEDSFNQFMAAPQSNNSKYQPVTFDWKASGAERFVHSPYLKQLGFDPTGDNEERYGQRQTWGDTMSNAFVGAGKLASNGFVDGWKGWGRMADAVTSWDWSKMHGDADSMLKLNDDMEQIMNENAIYNTKESEAGFFNRKTLGNFVQQSGFTVGTIGQMLLEQGVTKLVEGLLFVPTLGTASATIEAVADTNAAVKLGRLATFLGNSKKFMNASKTFVELKRAEDTWTEASTMEKLLKGIGTKIPGVDLALDINSAVKQGAGLTQVGYIGISGIKRLMSELNLSTTEARMEAAGTYSDMINKMTADYMTQHDGIVPSGDALNSIQQMAMKGADHNFNFNTALLSVMNRIQFDNVFKSFKSTSKMGRIFGLGAAAEGSNVVNVTGKALLNKGEAATEKVMTQSYRKGVMGQLGVTGAIAKDFGAKKAASELGVAILKSSLKWEVSEGVQELLQEGSNNYFKDLYYRQYNTGIYDPGTSFSNAVDSQMNMQGIKTFMSGALMGMITSGPMHFIEHGMQNLRAEDRKNNKDRNEAMDAHLDNQNAVMRDISTVFTESVKNFKIQDEVSKNINVAVGAKDQFAFENLKATALGQLMSTAVRNGTSEGLIDTLKEYGKHFSKTDFEKAFVGTEYTDDNKKSAGDYTHKLINSLEEYTKDHERLTEKYGSVHNPDMFIPGSVQQQQSRFAKQATEDMIEVLASNRFKAVNTLNRMTSIFGEISATKNTGVSLGNAFTIMGSEMHTDKEINQLKAEITNLEATPTRDKESGKLLQEKKLQFAALETWKEHKDELLNGAKIEQSEKAFRSYVDSRNSQSNIESNVTIEESKDHFDAIHDYVKLNKQHQNFTDAFNTIVDPKNFIRLQNNMQHGAKMAAVQIQLDAINKSLRTFGFSMENKDLVERLNEMDAKKSLTPEDQTAYFDLVKELHERALSYSNETADKYGKKVDEIVDTNLAFRQANEELFTKTFEVNRAIAEKDYSGNTEEELTAQLKTLHDLLIGLAYKFLEAHPELMTEKGATIQAKEDWDALFTALKDATGQVNRLMAVFHIETAAQKDGVTLTKTEETLVKQAKATALAAGYEVHELLHTEFNEDIEGIDIEETIEAEEPVAGGMNVITAVTQPLILKDDAVVQRAKVIVTTGINDDALTQLKEENVEVKEEKPAPAVEPISEFEYKAFKSTGEVKSIRLQVIAAKVKGNIALSPREQEFATAKEIDITAINNTKKPAGTSGIITDEGMQYFTAEESVELTPAESVTLAEIDFSENPQEVIDQVHGILAAKPTDNMKRAMLVKLNDYTVVLVRHKLQTEIQKTFKKAADTKKPPAAATGILTAAETAKLAKITIDAAIDQPQDVVDSVRNLLATKPTDALKRALITKLDGYTLQKVRDMLQNEIRATLPKETPPATKGYKDQGEFLSNESYILVNGPEIIYLYKQDTGVYRDLFTNEVVSIPTGVPLLPATISYKSDRNKEDQQAIQMVSGIKLGVQTDALKQAISSDPNFPYIVMASKEFLEGAQKKLKLIKAGIPERTHITHENSGQKERLLKGNAILTKSTVTEGFTVRIQVPGSKESIAVQFNDNYIRVNPDNTTEVIDFSDLQRDFLKANMNVEGQPVTDGQLDQMKKAHHIIGEFKIAAAALFTANKTADITELFNYYFRISSSGGLILGDKNQDFSDFVKSNDAFLIHTTIASVDTENNIIAGTEQPFSFPLVQFKNNNEWKLVDPLAQRNLDSGSRFVLINEGKIVTVNELAVINGKVVTDKVSTSSHRFLPIGANHLIDLSERRGTEPVVGFMQMMQALQDQVKIAGENENVNTNKQMNAFNRNAFTFKLYKGWVADFSLYTKGKEPSIVIQLEPFDNGPAKRAMTPAYKKLLNIYIKPNNVRIINDLLEKHSIEEISNDPALTATVMSSYRAITAEIAKKIDEIEEKVQKIADEEERNAIMAAGLPDFHLLLEYKMEGEKKVWDLKAIAVKQDKTDSSNFTVRWGKENLHSNRELSINLVNNSMAAAVQSTLEETTPREIEVSPTSAQLNAVGNRETQGGSTITKDVQEEEDGFESDTDDGDLSLNIGNFIPYSNDSFKTESEWIKKNLPADFRIGILDDIIEKLKAGKPVLGYYANRVIYLSRQLSADGTGYHEAFHGVFGELMNAERRAFFLEKALQEIGEISAEQINQFKEERNIIGKTDQEILNKIAEEYLADGFKHHMLTQTNAPQSWMQMLINILKKVMDFFRKKDDSIMGLYQDISTGKFAKAKLNTTTATHLNEGMYELGNGRPTYIIKEKNGVDKITKNNNTISNVVQEEMINRLTQMVSSEDGSFDTKFENARQQLIESYSTDQLLAGVLPANHAAAKTKFQDEFYEYQFALGHAVPFIMGDRMNETTKVLSETTPEMSAPTVAIIKKEVKARIESLGIENGWFESMDKELKIDKDEEDLEIEKRGSEFDKVNMNPMVGLSKQFRKLFAIIPYVEKDEDTGVTRTRMIDGNVLFNAIMKAAANNEPENIFHSFASAVESLRGQGNADYTRMNELLKFFMNHFGMDLKKKDYIPTKSLHLFAQFRTAFFVNELSVYEVLANTSNNATSYNVMDATIQSDIKEVMSKLALNYDKNYIRGMSETKKKTKLSELVQVIDKYFLSAEGTSLKVSVTPGNFDDLLKVSKEIKKAFDGIHLNFPQYLITNSLIGIWFEEDKNAPTPHMLSGKSTAYSNYLGQQQLYKDKSFLQGDFFRQFIRGNVKTDMNIFKKTEKGFKGKGVDGTVDMLNAIIKKAARMVVKLDISTSVSVFKNTDGENVYRYTHFTPPGLLAMTIRNEGLAGIIKKFPELTDWFKDNPLFADTEENKLFLKNFELGLFGGITQKLNGVKKEGVTFGNIDSASLYLSGLMFFMDRNTISNSKATITTFKRSRSQEEGTSTNYLVTGRYERLINDEGGVGQLAIDKLVQNVQQEYNRIQREWRDQDVVKNRYVDYNGRKGDNGELITDDPKLRAYNFRMLEHFFKDRPELNNALINAAKYGISFEAALETISADILDTTVKENLETALLAYMNESLDTYKGELVKFNVIKESKDGEYTSELIPSTIKNGYAKATTLEEEKYTINSLLNDQWLNIFMNKINVNQIFDGDVGLIIKDSTAYFKRNKASAISGLSLMTGVTRTAVFDEIVRYIHPKFVELGEYETKEAVPAEFPEAFLTQHNVTNEEIRQGFKATAIFDGQSVQTMNHMIVMMQKIGRNPPEVIARLKKARYTELTHEEIKANQEMKVTNNSKKSATGGITYYIKTSEHLLLRPDISVLQPKNGQTVKQAEDALKALHDMIDVKESILIENSELPENSAALEGEIKALYQQIHEYWAPLRSREKLHYLLHSMELSGIDQGYDPNSSKKATLIPVALQTNTTTDLTASKTYMDNRFKFIQQETSGVHDTITNPTQALQIITAYLTDHDNPDLVKMAEKYSVDLGKRAAAAVEKVNRILEGGEKGKIDISNLYTAMHKNLLSQHVDSNTLKMLEQSELLDKDGKGTGQFKPIHNLNLPFIKKLFTFYYFSFYSSNVFSEKVSGRHDILVSSYGYEVLHEVSTGRIIKAEEQRSNPKEFADTTKYATRPLGISVTTDSKGVKTYTVEIMLAKPMFENESHRALWEKECAVFFATRIPTEDKRSMIVCKVVDYLNESYLNTIVVPHFIHMLAGSDLDVDSLYSHVQAIYKDFNNNYHKYGDYSTYGELYGSSESTAKFVEYMHYMLKDPAVKELMDEEKLKVEKEMLIPNELNEVMEEMGFEWKGRTKEFLQEQLKEYKSTKAELENAQKVLKQTAGEIRGERDTERALNDEKEEKGEVADRTLEDDISNDMYTANTNRAKHQRNESILKERIRKYTAEIKEINRLVTMIAAINVLKLKGMPYTKAGLTQYKKDTAKTTGVNPVIPVMQNSVLDSKINILSNETVFNTMYIRETSDADRFNNIAKSIGLTINGVIDASSIYSIQGDVIFNKMNSSNGDGISISAAFGKFLAFAVKKQLGLKTPMFLTAAKNAQDDGIRNTFADKDISTIKEIGGVLAIFTDGIKNPVPSVLNLNNVTASVSNSMIGLKVPLQSSLLINKVPLIEEISEKVIAANSAVSTGAGKYEAKSFPSIAKDYLVKFRKSLIENDQLQLLYQTDPKDNTRILYKGNLPQLQDIVMSEKPAQVEFANDPTLDNLGFVLTKNGKPLSEEIGTYYLLEKWLAVSHLNNDIQKVATILSLVKKLDPSFEKNDTIIDNFNYLMSGDSQFSNIQDILKNSKEYQPLINALRQMNSYGEEVILDRNDIMFALDKTIKKGFNAYSMYNQGNREKLTDQLIKFIVTNKFKDSSLATIKELKKDPVKNAKTIASFEEIMQFYTADFWINNNFRDDLYYLMEHFKGNAFVDFIKVEDRNGFELIESMSRMKLDKDVTESIINGFQALTKSADPKAKWIANKLFAHCLIKDGLGYANNSFIKYVDPTMKQFLGISTSLNELQALLKKADKEIKSIKQTDFTPLQQDLQIKTAVNNVFKTFFKGDQNSLLQFTENLITQMGTFEGNKEFRVPSKTFNEKTLNGEKVSETELKQIHSLIGHMFPLTSKYMFEHKHRDKKGDIKEAVRIDLFIPSHYDPGKGKVAINMHLPTEAAGLAARIVALAHITPVMEGPLLKGYEFPMFVVNKWDQVFQLKTIDDNNVANQIENNVVKYIRRDSGMGFKMMGMKATYVMTENTGTKNIMNSAFTHEEGVKLNKHITAVEAAKAAEILAKEESSKGKNTGTKPVLSKNIDPKDIPIVGNIQFETAVAEKVLSGTKKLISLPLNSTLKWGRNKMNDGRFVDVSSLGVATLDTVDGKTMLNYLSQELTPDRFAELEGFKDWAAFSEMEDNGKGQKVRKDGSINFTEAFINGTEGVNLYSLKLVPEEGVSQTPVQQKEDVVDSTPVTAEKPVQQSTSPTKTLGNLNIPQADILRLVNMKERLYDLSGKFQLVNGLYSVNSTHDAIVKRLDDVKLITEDGQKKVSMIASEHLLNLDAFAAKEGYKDWAEFSELIPGKNDEFTRKDGTPNFSAGFINGTETATLYSIKMVPKQNSVIDDAVQDKSTIIPANLGFKKGPCQ